MSLVHCCQQADVLLNFSESTGAACVRQLFLENSLSTMKTTLERPAEHAQDSNSCSVGCVPTCSSVNQPITEPVVNPS